MTTSPRPAHRTPRFELDAATAKRIKAEVLALSGVADLSSGTFGEVSVLFAGERVTGIRKPSPREDTAIEIHVVVDVSAEKVLQLLADEIRAAALGACPELLRVDVTFADAVSGAEAAEIAEARHA